MLTNLKIQNFRCLEDLTFANLTNVNLVVGRNNIGKSTVLEALRIYAGAGHRDLLEDIAQSHNEKCWLTDEEHSESGLGGFPFEDLFPNRQFPKDENTKISIGEHAPSESTLSIQHVFSIESERIEQNGTTHSFSKVIPKLEAEKLDCPVTQALLINKKSRSSLLRFGSRGAQIERFASETNPYGFVPSQLISIDELADKWDRIVGTDYEEYVKQAMRIILPEFENIYFIRNEYYNSFSYSREYQRIPKVKLSNFSRPVPLKSLGEGMSRILQIAIKLVSAQNGFLLIDEFENGLHYSVHAKVWNMIFQLLEKLNVQVFATTHSWDCVKSFRSVWEKEENQDKGSFHRLSIDSNKKIKAVEYNCDDLNRSIERDIEVR